MAGSLAVGVEPTDAVSSAKKDEWPGGGAGRVPESEGTRFQCVLGEARVGWVACSVTTSTPHVLPVVRTHDSPNPAGMVRDRCSRSRARRPERTSTMAPTRYELDTAPAPVRSTSAGISTLLPGPVAPLTWTTAGAAIEFAMRIACCSTLPLLPWPRPGREWAMTALVDGRGVFETPTSSTRRRCGSRNTRVARRCVLRARGAQPNAVETPASCSPRPCATGAASR